MRPWRTLAISELQSKTPEAPLTDQRRTLWILDIRTRPEVTYEKGLSYENDRCGHECSGDIGDANISQL